VKPTLFRYYAQGPRPGGVTFEVKVAGDAGGIVKQIRQIVRSLDSDLAITDVRMQTEQMEDTLSQERLLAALASAFGALALILACIGIYGVVAYAVARRTSEVGIRIALGAEPGRVAWMILRETLLLAAAGVAIGIPAALILGRFAGSFLYGLKPNDPFAIAAAVLALAAAAFMAGYLPARRAAHIDPIAALRHD
jgi:ABC-type antimicrobial peptide transport system permease subunit